MTLVVDASVALKWFLADEPNADRAVAIIRDGTPLIAPDIVIAEVCNGAWRLARVGHLSDAQLAEIAAALPNYFDALVSGRELAQAAVGIAARIDHPVYDCLYVALAAARQTALVTADGQLRRKLAGTPWEDRAVDLAEYRAAGEL